MNAVGEAPGRAQRGLEERSLLQRYLVHKRKIPNGMDFLFKGPAEEIHRALKHLVFEEQRENKNLHLDYAQVEDYFLLRVVGEPEFGEKIRRYFNAKRISLRLLF